MNHRSFSQVAAPIRPYAAERHVVAPFQRPRIWRNFAQNSQKTLPAGLLRS